MNRIDIQRAHESRIVRQLVAAGIVKDSDVELALGAPDDNASARADVTEAEIANRMSKLVGYPFVEIAGYEIDFHLARRIPEEFARSRKVLPLEVVDNEVLVAMADPLDLAAIDDMRVLLQMRITPALAVEADLLDAINRIYDARFKAEAVLQEMEGDTSEAVISVDELLGLATDAPIIRLVNGIIEGALRQGASDIHIEPQKMHVRVRYRVDGLLVDQMNVPNHHKAALVSRVKVISHLNIAERRRPQDGRVSFKVDSGEEFDLRVSLLPTVFGEKVVMRLLRTDASWAAIDRLGFLPEQRGVYEKFIRQPHGIILVTGPTGSGKSTSLFAALNNINSDSLNISTIEDPVEYLLDGVNHVQVNPKIGVTFATGLRTLVRQDPDVIMVGEIRDLETAEIAVQAALTGHLVLSTLHTNDAPGALVRLQNMGVEPFLISSAVVGVIAQRLVRTICPSCKETTVASPAIMDIFGLPMRDGNPPVLAHGAGCAKCGNRGMRGRTGVYEVMRMTDPLREMVLQRCSGVQLRSQAIADGMMTMRECAIIKVMDGITTTDEVARVLHEKEA